MIWAEEETMSETAGDFKTRQQKHKTRFIQIWIIKGEHKLHRAELTESRPIANIYEWIGDPEIWLQPKHRTKTQYVQQWWGKGETRSLISSFFWPLQYGNNIVVSLKKVREDREREREEHSALYSGECSRDVFEISQRFSRKLSQFAFIIILKNKIKWDKINFCFCFHCCPCYLRMVDINI